MRRADRQTSLLNPFDRPCSGPSLCSNAASPFVILSLRPDGPPGCDHHEMASGYSICGNFHFVSGKRIVLRMQLKAVWLQRWTGVRPGRCTGAVMLLMQDLSLMHARRALRHHGFGSLRASMPGLWEPELSSPEINLCVTVTRQGLIKTAQKKGGLVQPNSRAKSV